MDMVRLSGLGLSSHSPDLEELMQTHVRLCTSWSTYGEKSLRGLPEDRFGLLEIPRNVDTCLLLTYGPQIYKAPGVVLFPHLRFILSPISSPVIYRLRRDHSSPQIVTTALMSLARVSLVVLQAIANGLVCTPPNPTSPKQRYHKEQMYILQIAPAVFKCHQIIAYLCAVFEVLFYIHSIIPTFILSQTSPLATLVCPTPSSLPLTSLIQPTPAFVVGVLAVLLGSYIRLDCFKTLGELFTFDLTIHPNHQLVTRRFYGYVRHPAYTGSLLLVFGLALSHLTRGSWLTECGPLAWARTHPTGKGVLGLGLGGEAVRIAVWASWWLWTFCVGISRADAEDKQMRKLFGEKWDAYALQVPWWFLPGLI